MKVGVGWPLAAATIGLVLPASARAAEQVEVGRFGGVNCLETAVVVPAPAERLARFLPAGYTPSSQSGIPGIADLFIGVASCDRMTVDGDAIGAGSISDVGIGIASPDGSPGGHSYELWQLGTAPRQQALLRRAGIDGAVVSGLRSDATAIRSHAEAPWGRDGYSVDVVPLSPFPAGGDSNQWWHEGPRGTARMAFKFPRLSYRAGPGRVSAEPGSRLAAILGASSAEGLGFVIDLDYESIVPAERPEPATPAGARTARERLRVSARPRRVRAGRLARLRVSATRPDGGPAVGARLHLAGRRAITNRDGRSILRVRFRRPGTYPLTVRLRGFRPARLMIRAMRAGR